MSLAAPYFDGDIGEYADENSVAEGEGEGAAQLNKEANGEFWPGDLGKGLLS